MTGSMLSEDEVHQYLYETGLEPVVFNVPEIEGVSVDVGNPEHGTFHLWRVIKARAFAKLGRIHQSIRHGKFIASKLKLPIDNTKPMELDFIGHHEDGLFVLELKVGRAAERNAFSELLGYSYYIAEMFALSGTRDITNVLVANLDAKVTRQAFLYDLLVANRNVIVYRPVFPQGSLESLQLRLYLPSDEDFRAFANELLSHKSMECVVAGFDDLDGWFDSKEEHGNLNRWTRDSLEKVASYAAQLMEADGLHGFCFVRKPWSERAHPFRVAAQRPLRADVCAAVREAA